jgi:YVTN family beta-propeller protein
MPISFEGKCRTAGAGAIAVLLLTLCAPPADAKQYAYAVNEGDGVDPSTVSVIDLSSQSVVTSIPVGILPLADASTPDGKSVYVANGNVVANPDGTYSVLPGTVSVIDTKTNSVSATINVGSVPTAVGITPDGQKAYVLNTNDNTISVVSTATNQVTSTISLSVGVSPLGIAFNPKSSIAYVTSLSYDNFYNGDYTQPGYVIEIDTSSDSVVGSFSVGDTTNGVGAPYGIAVTPNGAKLCVTLLGNGISDGEVAILSTSPNNPVLGYVDSGGTIPSHIAIAPGGTKAWVGNTGVDGSNGDDRVGVISIAKKSLIQTITTANPSGTLQPGLGAGGYWPNAIAFDHHGNAYVASYGDQVDVGPYNGGSVIVIDPSYNVVNYIWVGASANGITITK